MKKLTPLLFCIVANIIFLVITYQEEHRIRITLLHLIVGIIPLLTLSVSLVKDLLTKQRP